MRFRITSLAALLVALSILPLASLANPTSASAAVRVVQHGTTQKRDLDCGDFPSQAAAQHYFISRGGPQFDPDNLDSDGDGIACEDNACPCYYGRGDNGGGGGHHGHQVDGPNVHRDPARIVRVIDGDTVVAKLASGPTIHARLLGLDTPELSPKQCGAQPAKKFTTNLLPRGTKVLLISDPTQSLKDRYGRSLRYIQKGNQDVDLTILRRGFGKVLVVGKPFQRVSKYRAAQADARQHDRGNWGSC